MGIKQSGLESLYDVKFPFTIKDTKETVNSPEEYYKSNHWRRLKCVYKKKKKYKCSVCGYTYHLNLHHLHYRTIGKEPFKHLTYLCKNHHYFVHLILRAKKKARTPITGIRAIKIVKRVHLNSRWYSKLLKFMNPNNA